MSNFQVRKHKDYWDGDVYIEDGRATGKWEVFLPHQCDSWTIAGGNGDGYDRPVAIQELRDFLDEGQAALDSLIAGEEFGDGDE